MADLKIVISVEGSPDLDGALDGGGWRVQVHQNPGACRRCMRNEDPDRLPIHDNCKCTIEFVEE